jgi:hypothetical protein
MSERVIISHYENNYGGVVRRLNLIEEKLAELDFANADDALGGKAAVAARDVQNNSAAKSSQGGATSPRSLRRTTPKRRLLHREGDRWWLGNSTPN